MRLMQGANMIRCEQMIKSSQALLVFVANSEVLRKQFSDQLRQEVSKNEELINTNMQNKMD